MSVTSECRRAVARAGVNTPGAGRRGEVGNGHTAAAGEFNATAMWRICNLEGYLERKLHRQWRCRGS